MNDLRFAFRQLLKNPGFTAVAALTLALGIGANTAIFSVVNAVLIRPLPFPEAEQLVQLRMDWSGSPGTELGSSTFLQVRARAQSLARVAAYTGGDMTLTGVAGAEQIPSGAVTADFFPLLGVRPALGRNFTREEDTPNGPKVVMLGHGVWQRRFGGDTAVLGRTITLNQQGYTVIGILPPDFRYPDPFQIWTPLALGETGGTFVKHGEGMMLVKVIARLKSGVALRQAEAELQAISRHVESVESKEIPGGEGDEGGGRRREQRLSLVSLHEQVVGEVKRALFVLLGAVGFLLLIACANVANLLLTRAAARRREMAVRAALGAGRLRIARQLLTEGVLLSMAGGGMGLALAFWGVRALGQWSGTRLPALGGIGVDGWVLAFTIGVSVITGLAFGLAPAFQAWRTDVNVALNTDGRGEVGGSRIGLRHGLVVAEVAMALVLLIGAGLLLRSFARLAEVRPGFRTADVLTFQVTLPTGRTPAQKLTFVSQVVERLQALPGVRAAAATDSLPLTPFERITLAEIEGRPPIDVGKLRRGELNVRPASRPTVTPGYFEAMGIAVREGRGFLPQDVRRHAAVVIVNEAFERHHFPGESAVGKRIRLLGSEAAAPWPTVVGVVSNVRQGGLAGDVMPEVYNPVREDMGDALSFVVRVIGDPAGIIPAVRGVVAAVDPTQALHNLLTMEQRLDETTVSRRLNTTLLGGFAAVALLLAVVGIYGVMSQTVTQRRREIGVRIALGAQKRDVLGFIIQGGLRLVLAGVALGLIGALALSRTVSGLLFGIRPTDPATFVIVPLLLAAVGLLACWLPARRAARLDPMEALRNEG